MSVITLRKRRTDTVIPEEMRASSLIPVLAYAPSDYCFLMEDQSLGFGFLCTPLSGASEQLQDRVNSFLNQRYPADTLLQFLLFRSPDVQQQLASMLALRGKFKDEMMETVVKERLNFLQHATRQRLITTTSKGTFDNGLINDLQQFSVGVSYDIRIYHIWWSYLEPIRL